MFQATNQRFLLGPIDGQSQQSMASPCSLHYVKHPALRSGPGTLQMAGSGWLNHAEPTPQIFLEDPMAKVHLGMMKDTTTVRLGTGIKYF